ncbi:ATPase AAA [Lentzea aerocolonigenes]|uniref:ATPase AAA n=1 Tax=Lentzea aerocolonigenes TaxID=68170 RepID=A0A0F0HBF8_LENAE|nr:ATPase AAA [Lentzea aerocolonigenes]
MASVTPWWNALKIRQEILNASGQIDDVQMSLFRAVHGTGADRPPYADAGYYGDITHPTERLIDLLTEIAIRIGGDQDYLKARAVTRLDQGMGGGKSHACIGAYHLAAHPETLLTTEVGQRVIERAQARTGRKLAADLGHPHVVVLSCDNMTPGAGVRELDGPAISLYERFLWRLFSKDYALFERYQPFWSDKHKIAEAITAVQRPLLIVIDELLDYVGNGLDGSNKPDLAAQDMAFLRALLDVVNDVPHVAMVVVMIASDADKTALSPAAQGRRDDLNSLLERNGTPATVTEVGDFADILRRRLFDIEPSADVLTGTAALYEPVLADKSWAKHVWEAIGADWRRRWTEEVAACYPFHPMLMSLAKEEWSKVTGFQRVRSTIRIFAATVYAQQQRGIAGQWVPALIGPGDLPLSDSAVREAILGSGLVEDERTIANYRSLAEIEVINHTGSSGMARRQDLERPTTPWANANPQASERAATFIFLASIVGTLRPGRGRGASAPEVKAATSVPDLSYTITDADSVVDELVNPDRGISALDIIPGQGNNKPARYFLSTRLTHRMLVNNIRRTITDAERDQVFAEFAQKLASNGPFRELRFVAADLRRNAIDVLITSGLDIAHTTRLVVLDAAQYSLRNGMEKPTIEALNVAMGLGDGAQQLPIQWASSAVFAVANTQRRGLARGVAAEYLARQRALAAPEVQNDDELKATGTRELTAARAQLEKALKRAYQHVVYLAQPDPDGERRLDQITFDDDNLTALDGTSVWKGLAAKDKVFDAGQFGVKALLHNLRDQDYGKTLSDIRAAFYSTPRLPLLYGGDSDLRQVIYDAVNEGLLSVVDGAGTEVAVTAPGQVNLTSTGLRLARPQPVSCSSCGQPAHDGACAPSGGGDDTVAAGTQLTQGKGEGMTTSTASGVGTTASAVKDRQASFAFTSNLLASADSADKFAALFRSVYMALDERQISYLQGTIQLVLQAEAAENIQQRLQELGIVVNLKEI